MYQLKAENSLAPLLAATANRKVIMLGEASHGTHEYYTWRTAITKRLIEEGRCTFIAVEGDWPDCYLINR
jgi:erythromycin esterase-like protein